MTSLSERLEMAAKALNNAHRIVIGGGAGLTDAAGLHYAGQEFREAFAPFITRYGFSDLYTSSFHPFATEEERWAYWARHIAFCRHEPPALDLYRQLARLVSGKRHVVITTNVDGQFAKAGFPAESIFAVQGDYGFIQCARACHDTLYDNREIVSDMVRQTRDCAVPPALVPHCPKCGGPMDVHVHKDRFFIRNKAWHAAADRYDAFLRGTGEEALVLLELGVGFNTPDIIRYPFERMTWSWSNVTLIRCNRDHPGGEAENAARTIAFSEDMGTVIERLLELRAGDA